MGSIASSLLRCSCRAQTWHTESMQSACARRRGPPRCRSGAPCLKRWRHPRATAALGACPIEGAQACMAPARPPECRCAVLTHSGTASHAAERTNSLGAVELALNGAVQDAAQALTLAHPAQRLHKKAAIGASSLPTTSLAAAEGLPLMLVALAPTERRRARALQQRKGRPSHGKSAVKAVSLRAPPPVDTCSPPPPSPAPPRPHCARWRSGSDTCDSGRAWARRPAQRAWIASQLPRCQSPRTAAPPGARGPAWLSARNASSQCRQATADARPCPHLFQHKPFVRHVARIQAAAHGTPQLQLAHEACIGRRAGVAPPQCRHRGLRTQGLLPPLLRDVHQICCCYSGTARHALGAVHQDPAACAPAGKEGGGGRGAVAMSARQRCGGRIACAHLTAAQRQ